MSEKSEYSIYTRWLAYELRKRGFPILRTQVNEYHPQFDVYIFEDTETLHKAIVDITANKQR